MGNLGDATIQVDCGTRCDGILANLKEARGILTELIGDEPSDDTKATREPFSKMDRLELWLDDISSESRYVVMQLRRLANRIG